MFDLAIIGGGPVGLAAAIEAKRNSLDYVVLEKGVLANSIYNFPYHMRFFTTADLLEIGNHAFPSTDVKPTRQRTLDYYRRVTELEDLEVWQYHEVQDINGSYGNFEVKGQNSRRGNTTEFTVKTKAVMIATGYFDNPVGLGGVPGEDLEIVSHRYDQPHGYYDHDVIVIGAGNSGAEAALELYRHGARVTMVHKYEEPKSTLKYWVGPDLKNRIEEGAIDYVHGLTKELKEDGALVETNGQEKFIPADKIFILTGYEPHVDLFEEWGLNIEDDLSVELDDDFQSNREGIYVIGSAGFGRKTNSVFIENGREHAVDAVRALNDKLKQPKNVAAD